MGVLKELTRVEFRKTQEGKTPKTIIILGPPGVGKTETILELAKELAKESGKEFIKYQEDKGEEILENIDRFFILYDLRVSEIIMEDLTGVPKINEDFVKYVPPLWVRVFSHPETTGMILIDEMNIYSDPVKTALLMRLLNERMIGNYKLSDRVLIVAAGNQTAFNSAARKLEKPLVTRSILIAITPEDINANLENWIISWARYMEAKHPEYDRKVSAYLMRFKEDAIKIPDEPAVEYNFPTFRTWTILAEELSTIKKIYGTVPEELLEEVAVGTVGPEVGQRFVAFYRINPPSTKELLEKPEIIRKLSLDEQYIAAAELGQFLASEYKKFDQKTRKQTIKVLEEFAEVSRELVILTILTLETKKKGLALEIFGAFISESPKLLEVLAEVGQFLA